MNLALARMSVEEFFAWEERQELRHELVDGLPVPRWEMMTGASARHDQVIVNLIAELRSRLRGGPCRPKTADAAVVIPSGQVRRPDVTIECGPRVDASTRAIDPIAVIEVLSPSTRAFDQLRKLEEYKTVPSLRYILVVDTDAPQATLHSRAEDGGWSFEPIEGIQGRVELPLIGVALTLGEILEGLSFPD